MNSIVANLKSFYSFYLSHSRRDELAQSPKSNGDNQDVCEGKRRIGNVSEAILRRRLKVLDQDTSYNVVHFTAA
jgi:hypothetical protein